MFPVESVGVVVGLDDLFIFFLSTSLPFQPFPNNSCIMPLEWGKSMQ